MVAVSPFFISPADAGAHDLTAPPIPQITFQGKNVTNTTIPIPVAVGQNVTLTVNEAGASREWDINPVPTIFAKFLISQPPACPYFPPAANAKSCIISVGAGPFNKAAISWYLMDAGQYVITYRYFTSQGTSAQAFAKFKVEAPTAINVHSQVNKVQILPAECTTDCVMAFGVPLSQHNMNIVPGIQMIATGIQPPDVAGVFQWSQTLSKSISLRKNGTTFQCPDEYGLDNFYPFKGIATDKSILRYIENNEAYDAPNMALDSADANLIEAFSANTQLLWRATIGGYVVDSIPVPLGVVAWGWLGQAVQNSNHTWTLAASAVDTPLFSSSEYFLNWTSVLQNSYNPECPSKSGG